MAVLTATDKLTAIEAVKRNGVSEDQRRIIETMTVTNEMLYDIPVFEANDATVHTHLVRTALPKVSRRTYNTGVGTSASQTAVTRDVMTEIMSIAEVDEKLVRENRDPQGFLSGENAAFIEAMGQQQAEDMIYGNNAGDPTNINGLAVRRNKLGDLCKSFGGSGSGLTSLYLVKTGRDKVSYIYPKGASGIGVDRDDRGIQVVTDANGKKFKAYQNIFTCDYGLSVGNEKSLIRIANIDPNNINGDNLIKEILSLYRKLAVGEGNVVAYCNVDVLNAIDLSITEKGNVNYTPEDPWGRAMLSLRGIRFRQVDAILNTESAVTA